MPLERLSIYGNPNIGVYLFATDTYALIPPGLEEKTRRIIGEALDLDEDRIVETTIADMRIIGVMVAGNDNGLLLPRIISSGEEASLRRTLGDLINIEVLDSRLTALGNVILANDNAAVICPDFEDKVAETVRNTLGVEVEKRSIAYIPTVGSLGVVTNKGGVLHPDASDEELEHLADLFKVPLDIGTVNFGVSFIKTGLVANSRGALVGEYTTGPELARIQKALQLD